ncbi:unnamed protein product, partial [Chrysoparadoxa australica]
MPLQELGAGEGELLISQEDVHKGTALPRHEMARYLQVDFRDGTEWSNLPSKEVARVFREVEYTMAKRGSARDVVHVESVTTSSFFAVNAGHCGMQEDGEEQEVRGEITEDEEKLAAELGITIGQLHLLRGDKFLGSFYLLCQGLLA